MQRLLSLAMAIGLCGGVVPSCGCMTSTTPSSTTVRPEMLYVTDNGALQAFTVNTSSGTVQQSGSAAFPDVAAGMATYPQSRFLYLSDFNANSVYGFSIDANSGALTPIAGSPFPFPGLSGGNGGALAMDPKGRFVFFTSDAGYIAIFLIDQKTGSLTPSPTMRSQFPNIDEMIVEPSGRFLYLANHDFPQFWVYSIDGSTGGLTPVSGSPFTFTMLGGPGALAVVGSHLYAPISNPNGVLSLDINQSTGALTEVQGSPFSNQYSGTSLASDPAGKYLYIGNTNVGSISAYTIDASKVALTEQGFSPYIGFGPLALAVDPSAKFLFVSQTIFQSQILAFSIDPSTGALSRGPIFTLPATNDSTSLVVAQLP